MGVCQDNIDRVLDYVKPLNPSVSLTGGEPTKSKRLIKILEIIEKYGYRKRTLTTNGSGLLDIMDGKKVIQHIVDNNFAHLNISKAHHNEEINQMLMRYNDGYCSNETIETIAAYSHANNLRPRMSCLLLKDGISTLDQMIEYMEFYQNIGIDNVIFRELMDYDKDSMVNLVKKQFREFQDRVDWKCISRYQKLSEDFIREFKYRVYWDNISIYQELSPGIISDFFDLMNIKYILQYRELPNEVISEILKKVVDCDRIDQRRGFAESAL